MEGPTSGVGGYRPTINIGQAPYLAVPAIYLATAYGFLVGASVLLVIHARWVATGAYGRLPVILMVHLFTVGFLSMTAMGVLHQWVPVVFDVPAVSVRRALSHFALYTVSALVFAFGLAASNWEAAAIGGGGLALAILLWSAGIWGQLARSAKPRDAVFHGTRGAVIAFNAVWGLGLYMALSFLGWWPEGRVLPVHIATAVVGWMGLLVLTVQQKLNPMFSMSKAEGIRPGIPLYVAGWGVILAWTSLFTSPWAFRAGAVLWIAAAVISVGQTVRVVRQGKTRDRVFVGVASGWLLLLAASVLSAGLDPLAVVMAFWGLLTLIFSYQSRVVPFLVAVAVAKRLPGPVFKAFFMAQAMHVKNQPVVVSGLGLTGAVLSVLARLMAMPALDVGAGVVAMGLVGWHILAIAWGMRRGRHQAPIRA